MLTDVPTNLRRMNTEEAFRWRRRMGDPTCLIEWILQRVWLTFPYSAVVITLFLLMYMSGL